MQSGCKLCEGVHEREGRTHGEIENPPGSSCASVLLDRMCFSVVCINRTEYVNGRGQEWAHMCAFFEFACVSLFVCVCGISTYRVV